MKKKARATPNLAQPTSHMLKTSEQARIGSTFRTTGASALEMIGEERQAQLAMGYTHGHDDNLALGELAALAACFAIGHTDVFVGSYPASQCLWPVSWAPDIMAANTRIRQLVVAGALIAVEIERLQRARFVQIGQLQPPAAGPIEF